MKRSVLAGITAGSVLAITAVAGVAAATTTGGEPGRPPAVGWQQTTSPPGWCWEWMGRMHGVRVDSEADYLALMVDHHQEAVKAARQLQRSDRAQMRTLGASIVKTQTAEIATMKAWLARWYPGHSAAVGYRPMMRDLSTLSGDALDEAFLQDMIPHHMVAVMMSQRLLASGRAQHAEVKTFAAKVRDAQHAEMFQMQRYLADWFGGGGMPCGMWGRSGGSSSGTGSWGPGGMMGR